MIYKITAILGIIGAHFCLWGGAYVMHLISYDAWYWEPTLFTFMTTGAILFFAAVTSLIEILFPKK